MQAPADRRLDNLEGVPVDRHVVFGQVVGVHIDDRFIRNGRLDTAAVQPIARCGFSDYAVVDKVFAVARPRTRTAMPATGSRRRSRPPSRPFC